MAVPFFAALALLGFSNAARAQSWLPGEPFRRSVVISNSASVQTDYSTALTLDTASLVTTQKLRADCGDLRVTAADGVTSVPFLVQSGCNTASTALWVKMPTLPTGTSLAYVYYGNPDLTSAGSPAQTFLFFDDFSTDPNASWTDIYRHSPSPPDEFFWDGAEVFLTDATLNREGGGTLLTIDPSWENGWAVSYRFRVGGGTGADGMAFGFFHQGNAHGATGGGELGIHNSGYALELDTHNNNSGGVDGGDPSSHHIALLQTPVLSDYGYLHLAHSDTDAGDDDAWHRMDATFFNDTLSASLDGVNLFTYSGAFDKTYRRMLFSAATAVTYDNHVIDDVIVRRFVAPEPTAAVGNEESVPLDGGVGTGASQLWPEHLAVGCGCQSAPVSLWALPALVWLAHLIRRKRAGC